MQQVWHLRSSQLRNRSVTALSLCSDPTTPTSLIGRAWLGTIGIYGYSESPALYPVYRVDSEGNRLSGPNQYTLHFAAGQYPPVHAFWSLTMYGLPVSLLVVNPINRYLINSPMLPDLKKNEDGGLTLYIQNESFGKELESNWLPAPTGPFVMYMRLYWPMEDALDGKWTAPPS